MSGHADVVPARLLPTLAARSLSDQLNTTRILTASQTQDIQTTSCILSAISSLAALVTFIWFARMRRKFRHNLIFILITADVSRSLWLFVFCVVSLVRSIPTTDSAFCQVSGFFFQASTELADFAVLTIAVHTALQIFRPTIGRVGSPGDEGGLYRFRHAIYSIASFLPFLLAALAFVNGSPGYRAQGPYCSLPIRPFWFRLGLSWIPRYCILLTIVGLYIAIYIHVAIQFRTIKWLRKIPGVAKRQPQVHGSHEVSNDGIDDDEADLDEPRSTLNLFSFRSNRTSSVRSSILHFPRRASKISSCGTTVVGSSSGGSPEKVHEGESSNSTPPFPPLPHTSWSGDVDGSADFITNALNPMDISQVAKLSRGDQKNTGDARLDARVNSVKEMRKRHAQIQRQVRTLFIYPMVYFIMWLPPFVNHALNYSNYWAQNPIFWLVLLNFICISTMGWVDSLVFCVRERPWRSIPNSSGTFLGSFVFWNGVPNRRASVESNRTGSNASVSGGRIRPPQRPRGLGSIAEGVLEHEALGEGGTPQSSKQQQQQRPAQQRALDSWDFFNEAPERHWFDRRLSIAVGRSVGAQPQPYA